MRATQNMTRLAKYSQELYASLEAKTGVATGFRQNGSVTVAKLICARMRKNCAVGRPWPAPSGEVEIDQISPSEIASRYPGLNVEDSKGEVCLAKDGQADPVNITQALAKGARQRAKIIEGVKVTSIHTKTPPKRPVVTGVSTDLDDITADYVVNCGGTWACEPGQYGGRDLSRTMRVNISILLPNRLTKAAAQSARSAQVPR